VVLQNAGLSVDRLYGGKPLLAPTENWWEAAVTFNSAAIHLPRSAQNDPIIAGLLETDRLDDPRLADGVVALHYRARPKSDPGYRWNRSFVGLAVFTVEMELLKRYSEPIIRPSASKDGPDYLGVEDPRITQIGDTFYAAYVGAENFPDGADWVTAICLATSRDLKHWDKLGAVRGNVNIDRNKDGALFPDRICGSYMLLHRPMIGDQGTWSIRIATSDTPDGVYHDCGEILNPVSAAGVEYSWLGAGSVPIPLGDMRYLVIFHTGNHLDSGAHAYQLDAAIFDFSRFDPSNPRQIVESRLDRILTPETPYEIQAPFADSVANAVFTCGSYVHNGYVYIVYGGGDTYTMAARIRMEELLTRLSEARASA
jgi:predicted GH43/DUF377 family glycosyl hydrolase